MIRRDPGGAMIRCTVHLFLPPGWELGEGAEVDERALRALGDDLAGRCRRAADTLAALRSRGWRLRLGRYDVVATKSCSRADAMRDFLRLGLDPVGLALEEAGGGPAAGASRAVSS
jgi:hypothetical protein